MRRSWLAADSGFRTLMLAGLGLALLYVLLPLLGLVTRLPWGGLAGTLGNPDLQQALLLSMLVSLGATFVSLLISLPCAWWLAHTEHPLRPWVRGLLLLPMVAPPVVGGAALLAAFGRRGVVGQHLPFSLAFTPGAAVLAAAFVSFPFLVLALEAGFRNVDEKMQEAAATLGAGSWTLLTRITLPAMKASVLAGLVLTWARALGEFGATITFAGNLPGRTQTLPLAIYQALHRNPEEAYLLSLLLMAVSLITLGATGLRMWRR